MKPRLLLLLASCLFAFSSASAQQQFNLGFEVGGKVLLFGSVSLESYWEKSQFGIGIGTGYTNFENRNNLVFDTLTQTFLEGQLTTHTFPGTIYAYKTFGKKKNRIFLPFGISAQFQLQKDELGSNRWELGELAPLPFIGLGYELHGDRVIFRLPAYLLYINPEQNPNNIFPDVLPWLGLGFSWRLGKG